MAKIQASRFALLTLEDDGKESDQKKSKQNKNKQPPTQPSQEQAPQGQQNKKKKKKAQKAEDDELRKLAFARGGKSHGSAHAATTNTPKTDAQWKEWQEVDKEVTTDSYERDLQQAILQSKLESEQNKQVKPDIKEDNKSTRQKKKKEKAAKTMTLEQFQKDGLEKISLPNGSSNEIEAPTSAPDPKFFDNVNMDTKKIIRKEKIQEEYNKQFIVENARSQQYEEKIQARDLKIKELTSENEKLSKELKAVKERNQQLCMILAQGEMKEMANVVMELDQMKLVRDELTHEVSNLTSELEKERSKVHALQAVSDKTKNAKRK